ncbi:hypothetical protein ABFT80_02015 [Mesorhizobium sp. SB112]|uniref:hypothetical protein n=1 Tax=Mesorhizobium sp. SB112 TaxID=3151853 RepID=UPI003266C135
MKTALFLAAFLASASIAFAQDEKPQSIPFEGGNFTVTQNEDFEKILTFDGKELARNYVVYYDRTVELGDVKVALFAVGDGGNACGPAQLMVWKDDGGEIQTESVGEDDCGAPPPAVTQDTIFFVPYLMPGDEAPVRSWSPSEGLKISGNLVFTTQPGTGWADLDPKKLGHIMEIFTNEDVYNVSKTLLGDALGDVTTGLIVGSEPETLASGVIYARGCVPHACGSSDAFMAVDAANKKLYFAQQGDKPVPAAWPALDEWPADIHEAMTQALAPQQ